MALCPYFSFNIGRLRTRYSYHALNIIHLIDFHTTEYKEIKLKLMIDSMMLVFNINAPHPELIISKPWHLAIKMPRWLLSYILHLTDNLREEWETCNIQEPEWKLNMPLPFHLAFQWFSRRPFSLWLSPHPHSFWHQQFPFEDDSRTLKCQNRSYRRHIERLQSVRCMLGEFRVTI